jgi:hypothetical protein
MGDRTYLRFGIARGDAEKFADVAGSRFDELFECEITPEGTPAVVDDGTLWGFMQEANYGLFDDREAWAQAGLIFEGYHYEGGDYGAALFCAIDGVHYQCEAISGGFVTPAVQFDPATNSVDPESLKTAQEWAAARERVRTHFGATKSSEVLS